MKNITKIYLSLIHICVDVTIREMHDREQLLDHYKVLNGILFKLVRQDWKIVLTNKMLHKLIRPAHESFAHAAALKCYLSLRAVSYTHLDVYKRQCKLCEGIFFFSYFGHLRYFYNSLQFTKLDLLFLYTVLLG